MITKKLTNLHGLLQAWDEASRPSERSIRTWTRARIIPSIRIGRLVFYDIDSVLIALESKRMIKAK